MGFGRTEPRCLEVKVRREEGYRLDCLSGISGKFSACAWKCLPGFEDPLLSGAKSNASVPEEIARYMWRHFRYESDQTHFGKEDRWQSPEELLASRQGDCEDFALFAREILKSQGIKAFIVNVYGRGFGHSVCVFQKGGRYHVIDGSSSQAYDATDLKEIFAWVYPFWNKAAIVGFSESARCGTLLKLFER